MKVDISVNEVKLKPLCIARFKDGNFSELAEGLAIPCITIVYWIAESLGYPDELLKKRDELIKFYGYTNITGVPENCPWS
jgi:hypothetical protein